MKMSLVCWLTVFMVLASLQPQGITGFDQGIIRPGQGVPGHGLGVIGLQATGPPLDCGVFSRVYHGYGKPIDLTQMSEKDQKKMLSKCDHNSEDIDDVKKQKRRCDHNSEHSIDMKKHKQKKHTVEISFSCDQCDFNFRSNDNMKTHKTRNHDGETKFWRSPELVRNLLPYLDVKSTMALATTHPLTGQPALRQCRRFLPSVRPRGQPCATRPSAWACAP